MRPPAVLAPRVPAAAVSLLRAARSPVRPFARAGGVVARWGTPIGLALVLSAPATPAEKWPVISAEELPLTRPMVDPQADAEALFWEVRVEDAFTEGKGITSTLTHHVRVKVFTERGRESQSRIDLPYEDDQRIEAISARTISPEGQVVELPSSEIFDRELVKANRARLRVKTFVLRNVEVGSIVEYRWREFRGRGYRFRGIYELQRDIPSQRITYHVKPFEYRGWAPPLQCQAYNSVPTRLQPEEFGFHTTSVNRIPGYLEEPYMPPEREARKWMIVYYAEPSVTDPIERWRTVARNLARLDDELPSMARELKKTAAEIAGDARDPEERLRRIYTFCTTHIVNLESRASGLTDEERSRLRSNEHPRPTLEAGRGTGRDINLLFAALASAAGFEVRAARLGDRGFFHFRQSMLPGFLMASAVAVRLGDQWRFLDPGSPRLRFGMLRWQQEGIDVLVHEKGEALWLTTPLTPASGSGVSRTGVFRLLEDGTLEGEGRHEYSGHRDIERKGELEESSEEEGEREFRDQLKLRIPTAEVTEVKFEHPTSADTALVLHYRLRVPGYAKVTAKRLFIQPAVFQYGLGPRFGTSARRNAVDFHYPSFEDDSLVIELPPGYQLEQPDTPADYEMAGICHHRVTLGTTDGGRRLVYRRRFALDRYYFDRMSYPPLKQMFDSIHERDQHALALRQGGDTGP
jgi:hypothetical protein